MEFLMEEYSQLLNPLLHPQECYKSKFLMFPDTWTGTHQAICRHPRWSIQIHPSAWLQGLPEQLVMSRENLLLPNSVKGCCQWLQSQRCPRPGWMGAPSDLVWWKVPWPWQGSWNNITFKTASNPNHSMIPFLCDPTPEPIISSWRQDSPQRCVKPHKSGRQRDWFHQVQFNSRDTNHSHEYYSKISKKRG